MSIESIFNELELKALHEAMVRDNMSAEAVVRHFFRLGQLVDFHLKKENKLRFETPSGEIFDPFYTGPKLSPVPESLTIAQPRSCNRHADCDKAEEEVLARNPGKDRTHISLSFHCHSEDCEDCFGQ